MKKRKKYIYENLTLIVENFTFLFWRIWDGGKGGCQSFSEIFFRKMVFKVLCLPVMVFDRHVERLLKIESWEFENLAAGKYRASFVVFDTEFSLRPANVSVSSVDGAW